MSRDAARERVAPPPGWQFRLGVVIFAASMITPLGIPIVMATQLSAGMKATLSGLLAAGLPEVFIIAAVALLGKEGFAYVKGRLLAALRRYAPPRQVSRARYRVGLVMFVVPAIAAWIITYVPQYVPGYSEHRIAFGLSLDLLFIASFFVLGGDFWDKVRALFHYRATARFPEAR